MGKKIIVGCDGTWLNSDVGFQRTDYLPFSTASSGYQVTPSNVTRICRALEPRAPLGEDKQGVPDHGAAEGDLQIVDYEAGIGSANNWWDHFVNGATADSIGDNVSAAYVAIAEKWARGDEIFLMGFSRGAFVARSVAAMIRYVGLLTKQGRDKFYDVFQDWENQNIPGYKQKLYPQTRFDDETAEDYCSYAMALAKDKCTRLNIRIKVVAVWDTVGSLGVPTIGWRKPTRSYAFVDTEILSNVDYCFHAVALDEPRTPFSPTLWELPADRMTTTARTQPGTSGTASADTSTNGNAPPKNPGVLRQCWFPGEHGNIGGSTFDAELPDLTLAWMVSQLSPFLSFDTDYLSYCRKLNVDFYLQNKLPQRQWGMGHIPNPVTGIQVLGGTKPRTPGRYYRTNPATGASENVRLQNTFEVVHPSVRVRRFNKKAGKGMEDKGTYEPPALKGYKLCRRDGLEVGGADEGDPTSQGWEWRMEDPIRGETVVLTEEILGEAEIMLLDAEGVAKS